MPVATVLRNEVIEIGGKNIWMCDVMWTDEIHE